MTIKDVKEILGTPDWIDVDSSSNKDTYYYYFSKNKSALRSTMPYVLFDSAGVARYATYGEGG